ncbi:MAG TPA: hypothetical protein VJM46_03285 [Candidatus Saccharimonadales bacterium]|nr:hypothetical protein [Candidatus Saccharimonadales bacterium]
MTDTSELAKALMRAINRNVNPEAKAHSFVVSKAHNGQYHWTYYDGNYKKVATSGETFVREEGAWAAVRNVINEIKTNY